MGMGKAAQVVQVDTREERALSLTDYLSVVRRYWKGILIVIAVATAGAFGWYLVQPNVYAAESSGIVVTAGAENLSLSVAGDNLAKSKAKGYKSVGESVLVADRVIQTLGLKESPQAIEGAVLLTVPVDSAEIRVVAHASDPVKAQKVADAWVAALAAQVYDLEKANSSANTEPASKVVPLAKASVPTAPVSPNLRLALGIGAAAGLLLGLIYAFVRNHLDRRIRAAAEVERRFHVPVIGTLPRDKRLNDVTRILEEVSGGNVMNGGYAMGEALRELRTNLQFIDVDNPPRILLVTSSLPSEGKSTVIGNLAAAIAAAGEDVIVVDGDLRRPMVHNVFEVVANVGLTDILTGQAAIDDVLQAYGPMPNLKVLCSGRIPPNPSELLGSRAMQHLLEELSQRAIVLVDTPPLLPVTDAAVLSRIADGTLVVARARKTTTDSLQRALGNLARVRGRVLGIILNCVASEGPGDYNYGYYGTYTTRSSTKGRASKTVPVTVEVGPVGGMVPESGVVPVGSRPIPVPVAAFAQPVPAGPGRPVSAGESDALGAVTGDVRFPERARNGYRGRRSAS